MLTVKECTELIDGLSGTHCPMFAAQNKIKYIRTGEGVRERYLSTRLTCLTIFRIDGYSEQVKSAIDMRTVAEGYGLEISRGGGEALASFHNECILPLQKNIS